MQLFQRQAKSWEVFVGARVLCVCLANLALVGLARSVHVTRALLPAKISSAAFGSILHSASVFDTLVNVFPRASERRELQKAHFAIDLEMITSI